jgi:hypothetical protein
LHLLFLNQHLYVHSPLPPILCFVYSNVAPGTSIYFIWTPRFGPKSNCNLVVKERKPPKSSESFPATFLDAQNRTFLQCQYHYCNIVPTIRVVFFFGRRTELLGLS